LQAALTIGARVNGGGRAACSFVRRSFLFHCAA
jgi:hypothetical protein